MSIAPGTIVISALLSISLVGSLSMLVSELRGHPVSPDADASPSAHEPQAGHNAGDSRWSALSGESRAVLGLRVLAGVGCGVLVAWATGWPVAALACATLTLAWPLIGSGRRAERREIEVLDGVVVWTQGLRDTVAGGASLEQAIGVSVEGAPPALRAGLQEVRSRMLVRQPLADALEPLEKIPGADFVVAALKLAARRRGDRLPDVLSGIVATCTQEVAQRRQILAVRAGIHRSVQIIIAVTVVIVAWMATVGAAYMAPYDSVGGQGVLALVIAVLAAGFTWLVRLDTTSTGPGFLRQRALSARERSIVEALTRTDAPEAVVPEEADGNGDSSFGPGPALDRPSRARNTLTSDEQGAGRGGRRTW